MRTYNPTANDIRQLLDYDPETGVFTNLVHRGPRCVVGSVAGCLTGNGYLEIMIWGHHFKASRLAWLIMTGTWPVYEIDHINRVRHDNRWCNLRDVDHTENCANKGIVSVWGD